MCIKHIGHAGHSLLYSLTIGIIQPFSRYVDGRCPEGYTSTIGIDFRKKIVKLGDNKSIKLQLWDTAGE